MSDDERLRRMEQRIFDRINCQELAEDLVFAIRQDRSGELTPRDHANAFHKQLDVWMGTTFPEQTIDIPKLFEFLALLVCPPVCVGVVNSTGWHQVCERKAQDAIRALGFSAPDLTPIPDGKTV